MPKLELAASLKSYCQSPVNSVLASLKGHEQEVSWAENSNQLASCKRTVNGEPIKQVDRYNVVGVYWPIPRLIIPSTNIVETLALSKLIYCASVLTVPDRYIKE